MKIVIIGDYNRFWKKIQKKLGMTWNNKKCWWYINNPTKGQIRKIKQFCRHRKKLRCKIFEDGLTRGDDYRDDFFRINGIRIYSCAYCGKKMLPTDLQVDHIIPVGAVEDIFRRDKYIRKLKKAGIVDVNDPRNLVASCKTCNLIKCDKTGRWIRRGRRGYRRMKRQIAKERKKYAKSSRRRTAG